MYIDEKVALNNIGGEKDFYVEMLEYCLEIEETRKEKIVQSFEAKDWKNYCLHVHALRGGMLMIGIKELADLAKQQEILYQEGKIEDLIHNYTYLMKKFDEAHESVRAYLCKVSN